MKLRTKLALSVTLFTTLLLLLSFLVVTYVVRDHLIESRFNQLEQAEELMEDDSSTRALLTLHEDSVVLSRVDGRWVITNDEEDDDSATVNGDVQARDLPGIPTTRDEPFKSGNWFGVVHQDQAYLFEDDTVDDTISTLIFAFSIVLLVALIIAFLSSFFIAYQTLRPLRQLSQTMERISDSGTLETVPEQQNDEIGQLGKVFNRMIGRVDQTMEQQRQFVADVSHEMKTPLTVIEGYAKLLKRWGKTNPDVLEESISNILNETHTMRSGLIEPMLELSRLGYGETTTETIDLKQLGTEVADRMHHAYAVDLRVDATGTVIANHEALVRILTIFIDNAIKYAKDPELHLRPDRLEVRDRGTNLSAEQRKRLFDRFYRLDEARDRSGSGLGLSIAAALAEHHHLSVGSEARSGGGSCFYITFH
ncbi:sensor histidine kinase [Exiguobacterium antarcticum]|uniref:sensor histidine kinase n=1 Tax=Exiguobacterium antarcticum TaxID=132920 RepID=UPI000285ED9C|nr:HAMP domain-containing sensor histidine kinase [Exiguobacterium antarcticum]AFS71739.1 Integral membrane sensor signal transduction histidine kinase [Exiguobacterium antarcticum B7]